MMYILIVFDTFFIQTYFYYLNLIPYSLSSHRNLSQSIYLYIKYDFICLLRLQMERTEKINMKN